MANDQATFEDFANIIEKYKDSDNLYSHETIIKGLIEFLKYYKVTYDYNTDNCVKYLRSKFYI